MKQENRTLGKLAYAVLFAVLIPIGLVIWANATEEIVQLPAVEPKVAGVIPLVAGFLLLVWGMAALWIYGKGLPMNAYPPPVFVTQGPYRWLRHPIYWGFGMMLTGYFVATGSSSGFWMVAPLTVLGLVALVNGYESTELKKRFPEQAIRTTLDYPESNSEAAGFRDWASSAFWVLAFLLFSNYLIARLNPASDPLWGAPLLPQLTPANQLWMLSGLALVGLFPFALPQKKQVRQWEFEAFGGLAISTFMALLFPEIAAQYFPVAGSAIVSVPVFLILISYIGAFRLSAATGTILSLPTIAVLYILFHFSRSFQLNLTVSLAISLLASNYLAIWLTVRNITEKIANSWQEWTFGPIRVINHGFYVGAGASAGILLAGWLAGKEYIWAILVFTVIVNLTAGLWAQIIEGSAKLKRPFGYYGGIAGIVFGALVVWAMGYNAWVVIGVASVVMPWVQAIGRLRCLINGCCHGRKTADPLIGIRYFHPRSRVCHLSELKGELIHPTPLYSILWLIPVGLFLLGLWLKESPAPLIFGLYLILTSLGRFVEEAYRGEVQTPIFGGMHLYQWTAIISLVAGIVMTTIRIEPLALTPGFSWELIAVSVLCGLFVFFSMGVDFPKSNARFSRLV